MSQSQSLAFGPFDFDPGSGRLFKHGHRIKLQPKAAAILSTLLECPGELVSRAQVQKALWPDGIYVDFDLGIKSAVKKLRDALGDNADDPVYIQTIYGEGFRFLARVARTDGPTGSTAIALPPTAETAPTVEKPADGGAADEIALPPPAENPTVPANARLAAAAAVVLVVAALTMSSSDPPADRVRFQKRDWLVVAAFENRTGEAILDGSVEFALTSELMRSAYINVAPPDRIEDALTLMRQSPDAKLTEHLARQVAIRDGGIKSVLTGRVEKFGSKYVLTVRVIDPEDGRTEAVFERAGAKERLPDAAQRLARDLRISLGEPGIKTSSRALERATTSSLAALRAFSAAMKCVNANQWRPAADLLEEATREDPQFALAHIYAAHSYSNLNLVDRAAPHFEAAYQLAPGVTARERLFILGSYYARSHHDPRRAMESYGALVELYPDDYWGLNNLADVEEQLGMTAEAVRVRERQVALRPTPNIRTLAIVERLWWHYRRVQIDPVKSQQYAAELRHICCENDILPVVRGNFMAFLDLETAADHWWRGDVGEAVGELDRVTQNVLHGEARDETFPVAMANLVVGRFNTAQQVCSRIADRQQRTECLLRVAYMRNDERSTKQLLEELHILGPSNRGLYADEGVALLVGESKTAQQWLNLRPNGYANSGQFWKGLVSLQAGHAKLAAQELLSQIPPSVPEGHFCTEEWTRIGLATALEQQGELDEAIRALEPSTRPAMATLTGGFAWSKCRIKLAELYRRTGRSDQAASVESELQHFLSEADADHPALAWLRSKAGLPVN